MCRLFLVAAQVRALGFEGRIDALIDGVLALAQALVFLALRLVVGQRGLKLGAQLLHLGDERCHGIARGIAFDAQRLHFLGRELGTGIDRKSVVWGKSVSVRVDLGGRRIIKKKTKNNNQSLYYTI